MRYIIIGAGAVGGSIGGRLHESGHDVVLVARGAHYEALRAGGLRLATPEGTRTLHIPVVAGPDEIEPRDGDVLVMAVKTQHAVAALDAWAVRHGRTPVVCAQNGVAGERLALRRFPEVYGMCVWLPSAFLEPGHVAAVCGPLTGILHLGRYPSGSTETARTIAADLEKSHFAAPVAADVMRWKYAKLLGNLANSLDAVLGPEEHGSPDGAALRERAQAEGRAVLAAAGIAHASEAEQKEVRGNRVDRQPVEGVGQVGGSSWQSLTRGTGSIEADYLNGEIVLLGRQFGVPTPVNELLQRTANAFAREGRAPGSLTAADLAAEAN
ncbi:ketopantoate reductase family protein [Streptomyces sp. A7024]|uniref:Ketopantoate reductase family protein n=1 Tax=Streptomyces coryli TaxID=1128680 RepID=A0A6G4U2D1_9ACTN|nr:ketopantoate reductase family protein [Streptomyces coryli]NGN65391.1 ketopantoate reductase family protein [Streptomyces coryli]